MKIKTVIFVIIASLNLIFCKKNDLKSSTFETKEIQTYDKNEGTQYESKDLLVLADLIGILQIHQKGLLIIIIFKLIIPKLIT